MPYSQFNVLHGIGQVSFDNSVDFSTSPYFFIFCVFCFLAEHMITTWKGSGTVNTRPWASNFIPEYCMFPHELQCVGFGTCN